MKSKSKPKPGPSKKSQWLDIIESLQSFVERCQQFKRKPPMGVSRFVGGHWEDVSVPPTAYLAVSEFTKKVSILDSAFARLQGDSL